MKTCRLCGVRKPLTEFYDQARNVGGKFHYCKTCELSRAKRRSRERAANPNLRAQDKSKSAAGNRRRMYKLSPCDYTRMLIECRGACQICGAQEPLVVDHDHLCCPGKMSCGKCVRGLLCDPCNKGIGFLGDNADRVTHAAQYLTRESRV